MHFFCLSQLSSSGTFDSGEMYGSLYSSCKISLFAMYSPWRIPSSNSAYPLMPSILSTKPLMLTRGLSSNSSAHKKNVSWRKTMRESSPSGIQLFRRNSGLGQVAFRFVTALHIRRLLHDVCMVGKGGYWLFYGLWRNCCRLPHWPVRSRLVLASNANQWMFIVCSRAVGCGEGRKKNVM